MLSSQKATSLTVLMQMQVCAGSEGELWPASGEQGAYSRVAIHHDPLQQKATHTRSAQTPPLIKWREDWEETGQ